MNGVYRTISRLPATHSPKWANCHPSNSTYHDAVSMSAAAYPGRHLQQMLSALIFGVAQVEVEGIPPFGKGVFLLVFHAVADL